MAKIQGHLLKYRESAAECAGKAKELLEDEAEGTKDMSIDEWLHRLNLLHLKDKFEKNKIRRVEELKYIAEQGQFAEFEITTDKLEMRRLWNMMIGEQETKEHFKFLTKHGIRAIGSVFISNEATLN